LPAFSYSSFLYEIEQLSGFAVVAFQEVSSESEEFQVVGGIPALFQTLPVKKSEPFSGGLSTGAALRMPLWSRFCLDKSLNIDYDNDD
jgi:hypothetical protein